MLFQHKLIVLLPSTLHRRRFLVDVPSTRLFSASLWWLECSCPAASLLVGLLLLVARCALLYFSDFLRSEESRQLKVDCESQAGLEQIEKVARELLQLK